MQAEIISIGTELLLGDIVNTNAQYLSKRLAELGINVYFQTVVGDNPERILQAYHHAFQRADLVITSGGMGPTEDDLTKEMAARYFDREMVFLPEEWEPICRFYRAREAKPVAGARKQAVFPAGGEVLPNQVGTAPGCWLQDGRRVMALMPGPPREMIPMFENQVLPRLARFTHQTFRSVVLRVCGIGESRVEEALQEVISRQSNPTIATYAKMGEVHVRITARADTEESADTLLRPLVETCRQRLDPAVYGTGDKELEEMLYDQLVEQGLTIAVAESVTGGLLTGRLVNVPGMSSCLMEGVVPYTKEAKVRQLGLSMERLEQFGVVSSETAADMAKAVAERSGAQVGLSTTGTAGPDGRGSDQPGLVWLGLYMKGVTQVRRETFGGNRNQVRYFAANMALCWLLQELTGGKGSGEGVKK